MTSLTPSGIALMVALILAIGYIVVLNVRLIRLQRRYAAKFERLIRMVEVSNGFDAEQEPEAGEDRG
jgi:hypothetical protein